MHRKSYVCCINHDTKMYHGKFSLLKDLLKIHANIRVVEIKSCCCSQSNNLPIISTTLKVSIIGSMTSSGIRDSLLFCMLSVSNELRFSNANAGRDLML